jgi:glucosamine-6-phosphate deaminase
VTTLTSQTRQDNARFFASVDEVPHRVITQGLGTIMEARTTLLIATGAAKAEAVSRAVHGPITVDCPASILQRHRHAVVVLDEAAAAGLQNACCHHRPNARD